jgi:hypothetical protein
LSNKCEALSANPISVNPFPQTSNKNPSIAKNIISFCDDTVLRKKLPARVKGMIRD